MKGSVIGSLVRVMKGRNVSIQVKRGLRNCILLPTSTYGSETWTWNRAQLPGVHAVEMSYLRGECGVTRWDGDSNESVYERCTRGSQANGVNFGVEEWAKRNTLRWFGHIERMGSEGFVKKVYMSESVDSNSRGRPLRRWRNRVKEYICERGATRGGGWIKQRGSVYTGRGGFFCRRHPLGGRSWRE